MSGQNADLTAVLTARDELTSVLKQLSSGLGDVQSKLDGSGESAGKAESAFRAFGTAAAAIYDARAVFDAVKSGIESLVGPAMDAQKTQAQLNAVLMSTHDVSGVTAQAVQAYSDQMSKLTTFSANTITQTQNLLLTFTNIGKSIFPQATTAVLNMATALGEDTSSAAIQLGKALQDPVKGVTALQREGVQLTQAQKDQVAAFVQSGNVMAAQQVILGELDREFGDSAELIGQTLPGQLQIAQNQFEQMREEIGGPLVEALREATSGFNDFLQSEQVQQAVEALTSALADMAGVCAVAADLIQQAADAGVNFAPIVGALAAAIGGVLVAALWAALAPLAALIVGAIAAAAPFIALAAVVGAMAVIIIQNWAAVGGTIAALADGIGSVLKWLGDRFGEAGDIISQIWQGLGANLAKSTGDGWTWITNTVKSALEWTSQSVNQTAQSLPPGWNSAWSSMGVVVGNFSKWLAQEIRNILDILNALPGVNLGLSLLPGFANLESVANGFSNAILGTSDAVTTLQTTLQSAQFEQFFADPVQGLKNLAQTASDTATSLWDQALAKAQAFKDAISDVNGPNIPAGAPDAGGGGGGKGGGGGGGGKQPTGAAAFSQSLVDEINDILRGADLTAGAIDVGQGLGQGVIDGLNQQSATMSQAFGDIINALEASGQDKAAQQVAKLADQATSAIDGTTASLINLSSAASDKINGLIAQTAAGIAKAQQQAQDQIDQLNTQLADTRAQRAQMQAFQDQQSTAKATFDATQQAQDVAWQHDQDMAKLKRTLDESTLKATTQQQRDQAQATYQDGVQRLKDQEADAAISAAHQKEMQQAAAAFQKQQAQDLQAFQDNLEDQKLAKQIAVINAKRDAEISTLNQTLATNEATIQKDLQKQAADLKAKLADKLTNVAGELAKEDALGKDTADALNGYFKTVTDSINAIPKDITITVHQVVDQVVQSHFAAADTVSGGVRDANGLPHFDQGGVVPGAYGAPQLAVVHGGERFGGLSGQRNDLFGGNGGLTADQLARALSRVSIQMDGTSVARAITPLQQYVVGIPVRTV